MGVNRWEFHALRIRGMEGSFLGVVVRLSLRLGLRKSKVRATEGVTARRDAIEEEKCT